MRSWASKQHGEEISLGSIPPAHTDTDIYVHFEMAWHLFSRFESLLRQRVGRRCGEMESERHEVVRVRHARGRILMRQNRSLRPRARARYFQCDRNASAYRSRCSGVRSRYRPSAVSTAATPVPRTYRPSACSPARCVITTFPPGPESRGFHSTFAWSAENLSHISAQVRLTALCLVRNTALAKPSSGVSKELCQKFLLCRHN